MNNTHSAFIGYLQSRIYRFPSLFFGRRLTGIIWFFTFGLFLVGWVVDAFLIPSMDRAADRRYRAGALSYDVAWILLTFTGVFGLHRMYLGKWLAGILYLCTVGLFGIGIVYDFLTLNEQVSEINQVSK